MAVYYKFKSARDYDSIPMDGPFISVGSLKERIFESKHLGQGTDFDLVVTNAQTNEEYLDEAMLIPKNTSVLIRRVPGKPRMPIVTEQEPKVESKLEDTISDKNGNSVANALALKHSEDTEWDEFGSDLYAIPEVVPAHFVNPLSDALPTNKADEDDKIKALIETPALDWQHQGTNGFGPGRGFGRGVGGRMGGRGFGLERKTPPPGYVCYRCKVPGHFIQHCPTNGDPNYDIKRVKPPTGIPKSMLMATPDGSYALPSGAVAVLKPNEAAFEKEIEGLPSKRPVGDLPPELYCPLCKEVMQDAVLTSKCCFKSFCDKCIRDYIISKAKCICGATDILADDLLPNKTLRDTINRILESGNSSAENAGSTFQVQDVESARCPQPKIPSPAISAASKDEQKPSPVNPETLNPNKDKKVAEEMSAISPQPVPENVNTTKADDISKAILESTSMKGPASQGRAPVADEEVQQKLVGGEAGKKKKKKKAHVPQNDMWNASQDLAAESYMMPMGPSNFNPYLPVMQPGMEGYMPPMGPMGPMPFMGYGLGPMHVPFGGMLPTDPFLGQGYMMPVVPPQRNFAEMGMGMNAGPPALSREEFEARKAELRRRREMERRSEREYSRDREFCREVSNHVDVSSAKSKSMPQSSSGIPQSRHRPPSERSLPKHSAHEHESPDRPSKRKYERYHHDYQESDRDRDWEYDYPKNDHDRGDRDRHHEHKRRRRSESLSKADTKTISETMDHKHKTSVFSRISYPREDPSSKKRKSSSTSEAAEGRPASSAHHKSSSSAANGYYDDKKSSSMKAASGSRKSSSARLDNESSGDERHFKRKPSRYEPPLELDKDVEHPKHSRETERERRGNSKRR